jgi:hypothetical protein
MMPNAKIVGIESLSSGIGDMSHVQVKRQLPDVASQSRAHAASPELPERERQPSRALAAARRVFSTIRLSAHAAKEAEARTDAQVQGRAK